MSEAYDKGYDAGLANAQETPNPFDDDIDEFNAFESGFQDGYDDYLDSQDDTSENYN